MGAARSPFPPVKTKVWSPPSTVARAPTCLRTDAQNIATASAARASWALWASKVFMSEVEPEIVVALFTHQVQENAGVEVAGARAHHHAADRGQPHGGVHRTSVPQGNEAPPVAKR